MAANIAAVALQRGVPLAANAFSKLMPKNLAQAKKLVAQATGTPAAQINLGQVAAANGGMRAQIVAEAMVKAGMPVSQLWSHIPTSLQSNADLLAYRASLENIQKQESRESSEKALGSSVPTQVAAQIDEKNRSIRFLMRMFGTDDPMEVWNAKVELDHLHETDIVNFTMFSRR